MKKPKDMETDIFSEIPGFDHLMGSKTYEELTESEKAALEKYMSPAEYDYLHQMIADAKREEAMTSKDIIPDPAVKERLMAGFLVDRSPGKARAGGGFGSLLTYSIPLYQTAIAASVLIILFLVFLYPGKLSTEKLAVADTVYREKIVKQTDTVWVYPEKAGQSKATSTGSENTAHNATNKRVALLQNRNTPAVQPGVYARLQNRSAPATQPSVYARRQMNEALARVTPLTGGRSGNSISEESNLMKLVSPLY